jgi:hypothetical protein
MTLRSTLALYKREFIALPVAKVHDFDISSLKGKYTDQQTMTAVRMQHPSSHACSPFSDGPTRYLEVLPSTTVLSKAIEQYHVEPIAVKDYLKTIYFDKTVRRENYYHLTSNITIEGLLEQVKRSPKQSSPGNDRLGYRYLRILFNLKCLQPLIAEVYN